MTTIAQITEKMIEYSKGNIYDIDHFIRVWTYAKTIGRATSTDDNAADGGKMEIIILIMIET